MLLGEDTGGDSNRAGSGQPTGPSDQHQPRRDLNDPRAVQILTTEHWSLLSTRTLGYNEIFGRASILVTSMSGTVFALALLAQATGYRTETLSFAALLMSVVLFLGIATFV